MPGCLSCLWLGCPGVWGSKGFVPRSGACLGSRAGAEGRCGRARLRACGWTRCFALRRVWVLACARVRCARATAGRIMEGERGVCGSFCSFCGRCGRAVGDVIGGFCEALTSAPGQSRVATQTQTQAQTQTQTLPPSGDSISSSEIASLNQTQSRSRAQLSFGDSSPSSESTSPVRASTPASVSLRGFRICPTCRARSHPNAPFCESCGEELRVSERPRVDTLPPPGVSR